MKKLILTLFALAAVFLIVGALIIAGVSLTYGGDPADRNMIGDYILSVDDDVTDISLRANYGDIVIRSGSEFAVNCTGVYLDGISIETDNGMLSVSVDAPGHTSIFNWTIGLFYNYVTEKEPTVIITIPEGVSLNTVYCDAGIGKIKLTDIEADTLMVQAPFTNVELSGFNGNNIALDSLAGLLKATDISESVFTLDFRTGFASFDTDSRSAITLLPSSKLVYVR